MDILGILVLILAAVEAIWMIRQGQEVRVLRQREHLNSMIHQAWEEALNLIGIAVEVDGLERAIRRTHAIQDTLAHRLASLYRSYEDLRGLIFCIPDEELHRILHEGIEVVHDYTKKLDLMEIRTLVSDLSMRLTQLLH